MGVKKIYSKPEIEIDRSVFESLHAISDGWEDWGGWDDSEIDSDTESGTIDPGETTEYVSSFDNDFNDESSGDDWNWNY